MASGDTSPTGFASKEREPQRLSQESLGEEKANIIEVGHFPKLSPELDGYLEKIEKEDHFLTNQVLDDQTGQITVTSPQAQPPKIILPLTLTEYRAGLKESIESAWRWLSEWSKRVTKMLGHQVNFKSEL